MWHIPNFLSFFCYDLCSNSMCVIRFYILILCLEYKMDEWMVVLMLLDLRSFSMDKAFKWKSSQTGHVSVTYRKALLICIQETLFLLIFLWNIVFSTRRPRLPIQLWRSVKCDWLSCSIYWYLVLVCTCKHRVSEN